MIKTHQTKLVYDAVQMLGHGTNQQILDVVRKDMPELSITTVHRITKRLVEQNKAQYTQNIHGVNVIDARTDAHGHFNCTSCGGIVDIDLPDNCVELIQEQLGSNLVGNLTVSGACEACNVSSSVSKAK